MDEQTAKKMVEVCDQIDKLTDVVNRLIFRLGVVEAQGNARDALCEGFCKKMKEVELKAVKEG